MFQKNLKIFYSFGLYVIKLSIIIFMLFSVELIFGVIGMI